MKTSAPSFCGLRMPYYRTNGKGRVLSNINSLCLSSNVSVRIPYICDWGTSLQLASEWDLSVSGDALIEVKRLSIGQPLVPPCKVRKTDTDFHTKEVCCMPVLLVTSQIVHHNLKLLQGIFSEEPFPVILSELFLSKWRPGQLNFQPNLCNKF